MAIDKYGNLRLTLVVSADDIKQIATLLDDIEHKHNVKLSIPDAVLYLLHHYILE